MHIDTLLAHIDIGQRVFSAGKVTRYVQHVMPGDIWMIAYATRVNGKTKYARLVDFAAWAGKPGTTRGRQRCRN